MNKFSYSEVITLVLIHRGPFTVDLKNIAHVRREMADVCLGPSLKGGRESEQNIDVEYPS